jgi:hypothetical protein
VAAWAAWAAWTSKSTLVADEKKAGERSPAFFHVLFDADAGGEHDDRVSSRLLSFPSRRRDRCKMPVAVSLSNRFPFLLREEKAFDKLRPNGFWPNGFWVTRLPLQRSRRREGVEED